MDRFRKRVKSWICFFVCFALAVVCLTAPSTAAEPKVVRVGWSEDSYNITDANGNRRGYGYEFQRAVASYTGWKYEYVKADWSDLIEMLKNGDIDLMSDISYTEERAQKMLYSNLTMGEQRYYLYTDLKESGISPSDWKTLQGKRVGLLLGGVHAGEFADWEKSHDIETKHVPVRGLKDAIQKFRDGELDALVFAETPELPAIGLSAIETIGGSDIYFAVSQKRPELKAELDSAMRQLDSDNPFFADELYRNYLSSVMRPVLFPGEKQWLMGHGNIRIGWIKNDYAISEGDPTNEAPKGIINDYVKYAKDSFEGQPLSYELVGFPSMAEEMKALKNGDIDMIFHFVLNPSLAEQQEVYLSQPVLAINMVAVTKQDNFNENSKIRAAVKKGNFLASGYISYHYPDWEIIEYDSWRDVKQAVKNGEADCFVARAGWAKQDENRSGLHAVPLMQANTISFAVNQGNTELLSILNKTLRVLPPALLPSAFSMYTNQAKKVTVLDFVRDNLAMVSLGIGIIVLVFFAIIISFLYQSRKAEKEAKKLNRELQESHVALEKALREAEQASEAKTSFLFNMSHDIRTPMNALLGYAKLIRQELTDKKLLDYERKMEQAGQLLLSIINNVLDMARIESGKMELDESYSHVSDVLENVFTVFAVEAKKKKISFSRHIDIEHPHILCDVTKMQEILSNLISNAIKYTTEGGKIRVSVQEIPCQKEGYATFRTEVSDTGIGMSEEYIPHLFEAFTREKNTTLSKVSGTGLGMAIVKKMVDMMGGSLEVKSELGKGSTFIVTLTHRLADKVYYEKQDVPETEGEVKEIIQGKHILLAEDNELNAEIATVLLEEMGLIVDRVEDGIQCVSQLEKEPAGTYDLILMDVQMPKMDGYQATQAIRQFADEKKANIPIIAMTANAFEEDRKMAIQKGMNGHIAKPIDVAKVEKVLLSLLK